MNTLSPNVLISCAGRRNYLVGQFADALAGSGLVVATDASPHAVALVEADVAVTMPTVFDPHYVDALLETCRRQDVGVVISVNDHELPILAAARERFLENGIWLVVSEPEVIAVCFDKMKTRSRLAKMGLNVPATFTTLPEVEAALRERAVQFPLIVKPRWGSGSFGVFVVRDLQELQHSCALLAGMTERSLFNNYAPEAGSGPIAVQQLIQGTEYGLDIVNDLDGCHVATFVKQKLGMRSGETDKAVTVVDPQLELLGRRLGDALGHIGNLDCDVMRLGDELFVLDLNPRFGGGYPFSHMAGANLPAAILAWARGDALQEDWLRIRPGVVGAKCDRLVEIDLGETYAEAVNA